MKLLRYILAIVCTFAFRGLGADATPQQDRAHLEQSLAAKEFWTKAPNATWTPHEVALLSQLAVASHNSAVRLRATKLIIDLAGNGSSTQQQASMVVACFRHLEEHTEQPIVARLLAGPLLTHYTVSAKADGSVWVLLESVATGANRGGINMQWDAEKAQVGSLSSWGVFAAK